MPFEFAFLDWLYQFRNPVMNAISIFFDYAGAHGEIWIAFTLLLLLFRRTRKAGFAMAVALVLVMLSTPIRAWLGFKLDVIVVWISVFFTVISAVDYIRKNINCINFDQI